MATRDCLSGDGLDRRPPQDPSPRQGPEIPTRRLRRDGSHVGAPAFDGRRVGRPTGCGRQSACVQQAGDLAGDVEEEGDQIAPVRLGGEPVVWVLAGVGPFTPQARADRIAQRLEAVVHDRTVRDPRVTVVDVQGSSELRIGQRLLMVVTGKDAQAAGVAAISSRWSMPTASRPPFAPNACATRRRRCCAPPATRLRPRSPVRGRVAHRADRALASPCASQVGAAARLRPLRLQQVEIVSAAPPHPRAGDGLTAHRVLLVLVVLDAYLTYVLGLFPWTRALSFQLYDYVITPIQARWSARSWATCRTSSSSS